ncbi:MAG: FtsQ-type POTRA domain-containing protein [Alphaproteobacteria bacterium]|nr:FtsQ-type POTRA domain-containing protein [Alphaproteobacteria bacterium]
MTSGVSLARSLFRPLWPEADLRAAARGAGILAKAWLWRRRRELLDRLRHHNVEPGDCPERELLAALIAVVERVPRHAGAFAAWLLVFASVAWGVVQGGHLSDFISGVNDTRNAFANAVGFRISAVVINGRHHLSQDEILATGGISGRSSLLFLDADVVRERLKASPWIADATVLKLYPGQLQIDITERLPFALWQRNGRVSVIADDGMVLQPYVSRPFLSLPLVVGKGADRNARDFLGLLARYPRLQAQTRAAIFVGERRWNLRLKEGVDIRLPEVGPEQALTTLTVLDQEDKLLARDIVAVDLRLSDRLVVQLSAAAASAREEQFRDRKSKKKAGDA